MKKKFKLQPMLLLAIAAVLLIASTVGSTQAALIYYSDKYIADVKISNIGVSLVENGVVVNYRDYIEDGEWHVLDENSSDDVVPTLKLDNLKDVKVVPGVSYPETLQVANTGAIDSYVRVILTKYWADENGNKVRYWNNVENENMKLDPAYIVLESPEDANWSKSNESTAEREIYYYKPILPVDGQTDPVISHVKLSGDISKELIQKVEGNTVQYVYKYDGYQFVIEAEVQSVQTHNAVDAIKSAWGVNATFENGTLEVN